MRYRYLVLGVLITPVTLFLAYRSAGFGHGQYVSARLFYPFSMLLTLLTNDEIVLPLRVLAVLQFPVYGVLIGYAAKRGHVLRDGLLLITLHVVAVVFCFAGLLPYCS